MRTGTPFEVSKDVYDRARGMYAESGRESYDGYYYMAQQDQNELFSESIRWGYGLYNCKVHEEDGKYICTYETGSSCD